MPEATVRGITLNYRTFGQSGPWIALTPGQRRSYDELVPMAQEFVAQGFRVLLHDRRNCGSSEVAIQDLGLEYEVWADDLYELASQIGAKEIFIGGSSAGARLALLFAVRHSDMASGLLLWRVSAGRTAAERLAEQYYFRFARLARDGGMHAVCESDHFSECVRKRPANRGNLMNMDVNDFIQIMERWGKGFVNSADMPAIGVTEAQLQKMTVPACVISGNDVIHTPAAAQNICSLIPHSELHNLVEVLPEDKLLEHWDKEEWKNKEKELVRIFSAFIRQAL